MSEKKPHKIHVTLDTTADPPVVITPLELTFKKQKKHKVEWKQSKHSPDFTFESIEIDGQTFSNPPAKDGPAPKDPFSDVAVKKGKIKLKDDVTTQVADYSYVITVKAGDTSYSSEPPSPEQTGRSAKIRNHA